MSDKWFFLIVGIACFVTSIVLTFKGTHIEGNYILIIGFICYSTACILNRLDEKK